MPPACPAAHACVTARGPVRVSRDTPVVGYCRAEPRPTTRGCRGPLHDTNTHRNKKPCPRNRRPCAERSFNRRG